MRKLFVRCPWSVARCGMILSAALLLTVTPTIAQQETAPDAKQQKPAPPASQLTQIRKPIRVHLVEGEAKKTPNAEPTLEEMLNKALKENPDIKVAEAKVREADAELNRTRLQVTQKVLTFHHAREAQKATVKVAEDEVARMRKLQETNALPKGVVDQMADRLAQAKAKLAEIEAEMPYLLGEQHKVTLILSSQLMDTARLGLLATGELATLEHRRLSVSGSSQLQPNPGAKGQAVAGTALDRIRKALDTPVTLDYKSKDARQVLEDLEKKVPGISFHVVVNTSIPDLHLKGTVSLGAALQLVEDTYIEAPTAERCSFAIRDYGILFTVARRIPPGAIQLDDLLKEKAFWKAFAESQKASAESVKKAAEDKKSTGDKK